MVRPPPSSRFRSRTPKSSADLQGDGYRISRLQVEPKSSTSHQGGHEHVSSLKHLSVLPLMDVLHEGVQLVDD